MMAQLEIKKISRELNALSAAIRLKKILRKEPRNRPEKYREVAYPQDAPMWKQQARATLLCCIRAHHHHKIHCKAFETLDAQEKFIGNAWAEFEYKDTRTPAETLQTPPAEDSKIGVVGHNV